jgi:tetratricopeptide (TPR) repeat protein
MRRSKLSAFLSLTGGLYVLFALSVCWMAYAKARVPLSVPSRNVQEPIASGVTPLTRAPPPNTARQPTVPQTTDALQRDLEEQAAKLELDRKELELQQQDLENRSKEIDKRADDLEHLISEMTIGSSGYTLLLGLFAFFGLKGAASEADRYLATLKDQVATAKKDLDKARDEAKEERAVRKQEFEEFKREIRDDIPSLYGMQRALNILLDRIRHQVDMTQMWTLSDAYTNMSEEKRQTLVLAEMTVAALDYFLFDASDVQSKVVAQIFADLANFYSARARVNPSRYDPSDMRRALIYIDRAIKMDSTNARILAQRSGFVLTNITKRGDRATADQLDEAEHDLGECLRLNPSDVRGLYNLAWIADERAKFAEAVDFLTQIIVQRETLPQIERGRRMISVFLNRACAQSKIRAKVSDVTERQKMDGKILEDCKDMCKEAKLYNEKAYAKSSLARELGTEGDFSHMATMPEIQALIQEL